MRQMIKEAIYYYECMATTGEKIFINIMLILNVIILLYCILN